MATKEALAPTRSALKAAPSAAPLRPAMRWRDDLVHADRRRRSPIVLGTRSCLFSAAVTWRTGPAAEGAIVNVVQPGLFYTPGFAWGSTDNATVVTGHVAGGTIRLTAWRWQISDGQFVELHSRDTGLPGSRFALLALRLYTGVFGIVYRDGNGNLAMSTWSLDVPGFLRRADMATNVAISDQLLAVSEWSQFHYYSTTIVTATASATQGYLILDSWFVDGTGYIYKGAHTERPQDTIRSAAVTTEGGAGGLVSVALTDYSGDLHLLLFTLPWDGSGFVELKREKLGKGSAVAAAPRSWGTFIPHTEWRLSFRWPPRVRSQLRATWTTWWWEGVPGNMFFHIDIDRSWPGHWNCFSRRRRLHYGRSR